MQYTIISEREVLLFINSKEDEGSQKNRISITLNKQWGYFSKEQKKLYDKICLIADNKDNIDLNGLLSDLPCRIIPENGSIYDDFEIFVNNVHVKYKVPLLNWDKPTNIQFAGAYQPYSYSGDIDETTYNLIIFINKLFCQFEIEIALNLLKDKYNVEFDATLKVYKISKD
jgi:hypothetical protein